MALASESSESMLGPPEPNRSRDVVPTTIPGGASCPPTSGVDAGMHVGADARRDFFAAGAAPAARSAARQSSGAALSSRLTSLAPLSVLTCGGASGFAPTIRKASSTLSWSSTNSRSPSSRRCSRYRRSCSLGSFTQQPLYAIENLIGHRVLREKRQRLLLSVATEQCDAIRVDAKASSFLAGVVHDDQVQCLCLELFTPRTKDIVGLQGEADNHRVFFFGPSVCSPGFRGLGGGRPILGPPPPC